MLNTKEGMTQLHTGKHAQRKQEVATMQKSINQSEVKMTGSLAEHNLPLAAANHIGSLVKDTFPDSKIRRLFMWTNQNRLYFESGK